MTGQSIGVAKITGWINSMSRHTPKQVKTLMAAFVVATGLAATPVLADAPAGLEDMLKTAVATGDEAAFDKLVEMALETWPASRLEILQAAGDIQREWVSKPMLAEVRKAELAEAEAERKSRARGIIYFLDPTLWNTTAQFGAATSTGDTDEQSVALGIAMSRDFGEKWEHDFNLDFDFARSQGATTRRRILTRFNTTYKAWDKMFLSNYFEADFNRFSGFDYRILDSIALGTRLIDNARHKLRIEGGPGVRFNAFENSDETETEFLGRVSSTYELKLMDNIDFKDQASMIFGTGSMTFDNRASVGAQINSALSARLAFQVQYDSDAPIGAAAWDTLTRATLVYKF